MMSRSPIYLVVLLLTGISQACGSTENLDRCYIYFSPIVKTYNNIPDTIKFTGVSNTEIRADYTFEVAKFGKDFTFSFDSSSTEIHKGLNANFENSVITLSGKTLDRGTKFIRIKTINPHSKETRTIVLEITILGIYECL